MKSKSLARQERLDLILPSTAATRERSNSTCALEDDSFPFEIISDIAEIESWRKELNRPVYHIHKWWAQRLGTVFRAISIAALVPPGQNIMELFYKPTRVDNAVVFDPFMGSGTTVGEAAKIGARVIGRDINPVAHFLVRNALSKHDRSAVLREFHKIEKDVAEDIRHFYKTTMPDGRAADVLYYFWVKTVECPQCYQDVDLFRSRVFAKHAYAKKHPEAQALCPACGAINRVRHDATEALCVTCAEPFDPQSGSARGQNATCPECTHSFSISQAVRRRDVPPSHRLYAKLVLLPDGIKQYVVATAEDHGRFAEAKDALAAREAPYPVVPIEPGYNTNQALGYNYKYWHQMFNERQLLSLSILADRIKKIEDRILRELFTCLFSGMLEFNNVFTSFKGEGTGAVRHMFAHHILKPERMPLEANVWGTSKSSGSFMTMFEGRIRRALDYAEDPFEIHVDFSGEKPVSTKIYGLSEPMGYDIAESAAEFADGKRVYLSCGDSSQTDLAPLSVDAVITDPPFFDNVHYSQLADFFHVWQRAILGSNGHWERATTRSQSEVQNAEEGRFTERLGAVWGEAHRVLKDEGVLAFTYHHSRPEGWRSVLQALMDADFGVTAAHPIKSEMSVAMPKHQAKEPIDLDVIIVCRKRAQLPPDAWNGDLWATVTPLASEQVRRLCARGRRLSRNDVRVIVVAQLIRCLSRSESTEQALSILETSSSETEDLINLLHSNKIRRTKREP